jgi:hypothetical protein
MCVANVSAVSAFGHEFRSEDTTRLWGWRAVEPRPAKRAPRRAIEPKRARG